MRPATLDDVELVADLETARTPDDPQDGVMVGYWWTHEPEEKHALRLIGETNGAADVFISARHVPWEGDDRRYGWLGVSIRPSAWNPDLYRGGIAHGEAWLREEKAQVSVAWERADFEKELSALGELGYRELRRERYWELDLVARHAELLAGAERGRADMRRQGIDLLTLDQVGDPETLRKIHALDLATTKDIPTTVPEYAPAFDEWLRIYFENPAVRKDRYWMARRALDRVHRNIAAVSRPRHRPRAEVSDDRPGDRARSHAGPNR